MRRSVASNTPWWLPGLALFLAVFAVYTPVWWAGFVWDDSVNITENPCIIGPLGLKEIWTTSAAQFYPLVLTTLWAVHALFGLQPLPFHLVNVFMHVACAVALWQVLRNLSVPGAWLGAALWALHPVQVESVAWISELKNTQSGFFYLLSILFFIRHLKSSGATKLVSWDRDYALTLLFALLALASKSSTVILPLVLCLCAWWVEGRWHWRNLLKVAPIVVVACVACAMTVWTQVFLFKRLFADPPGSHTWLGHFAAAGEGFWFYLGKVIWPYPLVALYPHLNIDIDDPLSYLPTLALLIGMLGLWWWRNSWARPWFFAFGYFLLALLPELEFAGWYIGDHFQYLACIGPLALAGSGLQWLAQKFRWQKPMFATEGLLLSVLAVLSWIQACEYIDEEALWTPTVAENPNSAMARYNLGVGLKNNEHWDAAIEQLQRSLELDSTPANVLASYNLGVDLAHQGLKNEAIAEYQRTIRLDAKRVKAIYNLSGLLIEQGRVDEAMDLLRQGMAVNPDFAPLHTPYGAVLAMKGHPQEAIAEFRKVLQVDPNNSDAQRNLEKALAAEAAAQKK